MAWFVARLRECHPIAMNERPLMMRSIETTPPTHLSTLIYTMWDGHADFSCNDVEFSKE
jgi:hypothetical protein